MFNRSGRFNNNTYSYSLFFNDTKIANDSKEVIPFIKKMLLATGMPRYNSYEIKQETELKEPFFILETGKYNLSRYNYSKNETESYDISLKEDTFIIFLLEVKHQDKYYKIFAPEVSSRSLNLEHSNIEKNKELTFLQVFNTFMDYKKSVESHLRYLKKDNDKESIEEFTNSTDYSFNNILKINKTKNIEKKQVKTKKM